LGVLDDLDEVALTPDTIPIPLKVRRAVPIHATRAKETGRLAGKWLVADHFARHARPSDFHRHCFCGVEYFDSHTQTFSLYLTRVHGQKWRATHDLKKLSATETPIDLVRGHSQQPEMSVPPLMEIKCTFRSNPLA
jgi:hypothetical protein